jgi:hypothetical protein
MTFAAALLDPAADPPGGLKHGQRLSIYRNNIAAALTNALAVRYPAVQRMAGEEYFAVLARGFAGTHPPQSPVLIAYGAEFPAYLSLDTTGCRLPWLADLATFESAWWEAYHAREMPLLAATALLALSPEELGNASLEFHASVATVASRYPLAALWQGDAADCRAGESRTYLVCRPQADVIVRVLAPETAWMIQRLRQQATLGAVAAELAATWPAADLAAQLRGLLSLEIISGISGRSQT